MEDMIICCFQSKKPPFREVRRLFRGCTAGCGRKASIEVLDLKHSRVHTHVASRWVPFSLRPAKLETKVSWICPPCQRFLVDVWVQGGRGYKSLGPFYRSWKLHPPRILEDTEHSRGISEIEFLLQIWWTLTSDCIAFEAKITCKH